jgi:hypothetical protein
VRFESARVTLRGMDTGPLRRCRRKPKRQPPRRRALVRIPRDLPVTQIEIEVVAALLDDWESLVPGMAEAE